MWQRPDRSDQPSVESSRRQSEAARRADPPTDHLWPHGDGDAGGRRERGRFHLEDRRDADVADRQEKPTLPRGERGIVEHGGRSGHVPPLEALGVDGAGTLRQVVEPRAPSGQRLGIRQPRRARDREIAVHDR
ncbi:MAG: hypothetical protein ACKOTB_04480, partial [Planctomycetia bacterium]